MALEVKSTPTLRSSTTKSRAKNNLEYFSKRKEEPKTKKVTRGPILHTSTDSSSSSCSSSKETGFRPTRRTKKSTVMRPVKVAPEPVKVLPRTGIDVDFLLPHSLIVPGLVKKRCAWITANSEEVYGSFHDEEWGFQVRDDQKLFELLIFSEALAELSWPAILNKRDVFRKLFANFEPSAVAEFTDKGIISFKSSGSSLLSEQKLRAVVENARQMLKVIEEFGSFSCYCWSFVNHRPIVNGYRYARQVPAKTPKAEAMSKDMMRRGFRCVGPTVIYSFMQAAGLVNDHLASCFRYEECIHLQDKLEMKINAQEMAAISQAEECLFTTEGRLI